MCPEIACMRRQGRLPCMLMLVRTLPAFLLHTSSSCAALSISNGALLLHFGAHGGPRTLVPDVPWLLSRTPPSLASLSPPRQTPHLSRAGLFVTAAQNSGADITRGYFPANYVNDALAGRCVLPVAATNAAGALTSWSNWGEAVRQWL